MYPATNSFPATYCPANPSGRTDYALFKNVFEELSRRVIEASGPMMKTLEEFGIGATCDWAITSKKLKMLFTEILTSQPDQAIFGWAFTGVDDPRRTMIASICMGLGLSQQHADQVAGGLVQRYRVDNQRFETCREYQQAPVNGTTTTVRVCHSYTPRSDDHNFWSPLTMWRSEFMRACSIYAELRRVKSLAQQPFKGTPQNARPGIDQTVDLMKLFPAFLEQVYSDANLCNVKGFPPQVARGMKPTSDDARFVARVAGEINHDWWVNFGITTGLTILAIVASAVTGGAAGFVISVGFSVAKGGHAVYQADAALDAARHRQKIGGVSQSDITALEGDLQGAWAALVIDTVTAGVFTKFGGASAIEGAVSGSLLTGYGSALAAALHPNVWNHPHREALILKAFVVGSVMGYALGGLDKGLSKHMSSRSFQVGVSRGEGLKVGSTAHISGNKNVAPVAVKVTQINKSTNTVTFEAADGGMINLQMSGAPIEVIVKQ